MSDQQQPSGGQACKHLEPGAFYEDHARDMRDPEYREAFDQAARRFRAGVAHERPALDRSDDE